MAFGSILKKIRGKLGKGAGGGVGAKIMGRLGKKRFGGGGLLGKMFGGAGGKAFGGFRNMLRNRAGSAPGGEPGLPGMPGAPGGGGPTGMHKFLGRFRGGIGGGKFSGLRGKLKKRGFGSLFGRRGGGY